MSSLYLGIDISKASCAISLLSKQLLQQYKRHDKCPSLAIEQSRAGFDQLLQAIQQYAPAEECHVLVEKTGHYGMALEQYLQEYGVKLYRVRAQGRKKKTKNKSDKRDAQMLAGLLYNQVELGVQVLDKDQQVSPLVPPGPAARLLRGLNQHREELVRETTRRKNKLTAIVDELFPELTQVFKDPNKDAALCLRAKFPTPQAILSARLDDLIATRPRSRPGDKDYMRLYELAQDTIGTKDDCRIESLIIEQEQLIAELRLLEKHIETLEAKIIEAVNSSREGQILTSFIGISHPAAASIISSIGSIANFESAACLRSYMGWSPKQSQTGKTYDNESLNRAGNKHLRKTIYMAVMCACKYDPRWKEMHDRLIPIKCVWDARKKTHRGKNKVIGKISGLLIGIMYKLLKNDYDVIARLQPGEVAPPPVLYDPSHATPPSSGTAVEGQVRSIA